MFRPKFNFPKTETEFFRYKLTFFGEKNRDFPIKIEISRLYITPELSMLMVWMNQCLVPSTAQFSTLIHSMDRWAAACKFEAEKKLIFQTNRDATFRRQSELAQTTSMTYHQSFFDLDFCLLFYHSLCWMKKNQFYHHKRYFMFKNVNLY